MSHETQVKNCTLSSVISLWETLEVEQARRAVLANQVRIYAYTYHVCTHKYIVLLSA